MDKFHIGQKVKIIKSYIPERIGTVATIMTQRVICPHVYYGELAFVYFLDLALLPSHPSPYGVAYPEECLEPIFDGDEKSSWEICEWKPKAQYGAALLF